MFRETCLVAFLGIAGGAACSNSLAPFGEVVFSVDTDMAIPRFIDSLRVDTYSADGTWFDSHDYAVYNARDWPLSFGIYSEDLDQDTAIYVRFRGYTSARTRDYRGERYADESGIVPGDPPKTVATQLPRLMVGGVDATPLTEPEPMTTIDRVVKVVIKHGEVNGAHVLLQGDCIGSMAAITAGDSYKNFDPTGVRTCVDTAATRVGVGVTKFTSDKVSGSVQGTWNATTACSGSSALGICVPGGAFFIGSYDSVGWDIPSTPQRIIALSPFRIDANEVSVAAYRTAVSKGFKSPDSTPWPYDADITPTQLVPMCTYSLSAHNRETFPLNCISFEAAQAYCKAQGGDLPTEAQWEYAAAAAGRTTEAPYPWGDALYPTCAQEVFQRFTGGSCASGGVGPQSIDTATKTGQDVTILGVLNLGGSMSEWVLGSPLPYSDPCWGAGPKDTTCNVSGSSKHVVRGASWGSDGSPVSDRISADFYNPQLGFRCAYKGTP